MAYTINLTDGSIFATIADGTINTASSMILVGKNYAGYGYYYDEQKDAFIPPQPYPSWVLNEDTCCWDAPVPQPTDGKMYAWDETQLNWVEISA